MVRVFTHGSVELQRHRIDPFKVNGQRVKQYIGTTKEIRSYRRLNLDEVLVVKRVGSCHEVKLGTSLEATHMLVGEV